MASDVETKHPELRSEEKANSAEALLRESKAKKEAASAAASQEARTILARPKHCIVALDHTSKSDAVLNWCANFLRNEPGFKVTFLNVYDASSYVPYDTTGNTPEDTISLRNRAVEYGSDMLKRLQRKSIEMGFSATEAKLLAQTPMTGTTKETILEYVKKHNPDMLVCGSRGLGPMGRLFVGSVSDYLVHNCACTVVVVKENSQQDDELKREEIPIVTQSWDPPCEATESNNKNTEPAMLKVPTLTDDTGWLYPGLERVSPAPPSRLQKGIAKLRSDEDPSKVFCGDYHPHADDHDERADVHGSC
uniref:UspA domain-containing protein n=1 Tax=Lotharella oceanica TaxID=641309 RepID=A0A7S2TJF7_9EUKA